MAYVKDGFMMKSRPQLPDDDVILIQSDDDAESDDVVLVSDSDSSDFPRLPSSYRKSRKKRSRQKRKNLRTLCDLSKSTEFHNRSSVSSHLDISSEVNFCVQSNSEKETTRKALNHSLFLNDRGRIRKLETFDQGFRTDNRSSHESELYSSAANTSSSLVLTCQRSAYSLPGNELRSMFDQNFLLVENTNATRTIAEQEFPEKADGVAETTGEAGTQDEFISRDEMALLADVDVSLLSNISFCSDLSNDLPGDLPSTLASELAIDLANEFTSLESGLEMEEAAGSLECNLPLGSVSNCLQIPPYSEGIVDSCPDGTLPPVMYHCEGENPMLSANLSEADKFCNLGSVHENSCNMQPLAARNLCDVRDALPAMNGNSSSSANVCDLENAAGNLYSIGNSHSTGNLLEMGIFSELGNPVEIGSLSAMDGLQEFQILPDMVTEEIYLEDKDLEVDLSSTFIKDVLNLNVGETVSNPLCEPLNFSSIVSAFDSLMSVAPHLALSSDLPVSLAQHPLISSAPSSSQHPPLSLESTLSFASQHLLSSSDTSVTSDPHSLLTCAASTSVSQHLPPFSLVSSAQHIELSTLASQHLPLSSDSSVSFTVRPQLPSTSSVEQRLLPSASFSPNSEVLEESPESISMMQETAEELQLRPISCEQIEDLLKKSNAVELDDRASLTDGKIDADSEDLVEEMPLVSSDSPYSSVVPPLPQPDFVASGGQMVDNADLSLENSASVLHSTSENGFTLTLASIPLTGDGISILSVSSPGMTAFEHRNCNEEDPKMVASDSPDSLKVQNGEDVFRTDQFSPLKISILNECQWKTSTDPRIDLGFDHLSTRAQKADGLVVRILKNQNSSLTDSCCPLVTDEVFTTKYENRLSRSLMTLSNSVEGFKSSGSLELEKNEDGSGECFLSQYRLAKRPRKESAGTVDEPLIDLASKKVRLDEEAANEDKQFREEDYEETGTLEESCDVIADDLNLGERPENLNEDSNEFEEENQNLNEGFQDDSNESGNLEETDLHFCEEIQNLMEKEQNHLEETLDFNEGNEELEETNQVLNERLQEVGDLDEDVLVNNEDLSGEEDGVELDDLDKEPNDLSEENEISEEENLDLNEEIADPSRKSEDFNKDDLDMNEASQNLSKNSYSLNNRSVKINDQILHLNVTNYEHTKENLQLNTKNCSLDKEDLVIRSQNKSDLDYNYNRLSDTVLQPEAPSPSLGPSLPLAHESGNDRSLAGVTMNRESVDVLKAKCFNCSMEIAKSVLAYCTAGHGCCSGCLHGQVKAFLATSSKSPFSCQFQGCNSFYLISQLRSSLPKMVVDILEAKLEREYSDSTAQLLKKVNGIREMNNITDDEQDNVELVCSPGTSLPYEISAAKDAFELPLRWGEANKNEYELVDVTVNSDEFAEVSELFHRTMLKSRATILRLQRLQNPVLWEFYTVKKKQKEMEGVDKRSFERLLFHGIRQEFVDTICLNNFDWRTCGVSHGIMYGQGTYFARDASYAHRYTDRNPSAIKKSSSAHLDITTSDDMTLALQSDDCDFSLTSLSDAPSVDSEVQAVSELPAPTKVTPGDWETHVHLMFLARVIVGRYTRGKRTFRKPPPIDLFAPYGKCYDSCVNYIDDPTLFVIFDSSQYYPEYLIHYTNRPKMSP